MLQCVGSFELPMDSDTTLGVCLWYFAEHLVSPKLGFATSPYSFRAGLCSEQSLTIRCSNLLISLKNSEKNLGLSTQNWGIWLNPSDLWTHMLNFCLGRKCMHACKQAENENSSMAFPSLQPTSPQIICERIGRWNSNSKNGRRRQKPKQNPRKQEIPYVGGCRDQLLPQVLIKLGMWCSSRVAYYQRFGACRNQSIATLSPPHVHLWSCQYLRGSKSKTYLQIFQP